MPHVLDGKGVEVARISHNGKVWVEDGCIFDPYELGGEPEPADTDGWNPEEAPCGQDYCLGITISEGDEGIGVERCDDCKRFDCDDDAMIWLYDNFHLLRLSADEEEPEEEDEPEPAKPAKRVSQPKSKSAGTRAKGGSKKRKTVKS